MPLVATKQMLHEARQAYHLLVQGRSVREIVDQNGERVTYTAANRGDLYNYIQQLEGLLPGEGGVAVPTNGPAGFFF